MLVLSEGKSSSAHDAIISNDIGRDYCGVYKNYIKQKLPWIKMNLNRIMMNWTKTAWDGVKNWSETNCGKLKKITYDESNRNPNCGVIK